MENGPDAHLQLHLLSEITGKMRNGSRSLRALALRARNNMLPLTCAPQIFYPSFNAMGDKCIHPGDKEISGEKDINNEVVGVPAETKNLTATMRVTSLSDDLFEAKVMVLLETIKHYVEDEEQPGGRFAEVKKSEMNVQAPGEQSCVREEVQAEASQAGDEAA